MRPESSDLPQAEQLVPCIACGKPSECAIWGNRVCYPCAIDWKQRSPDYTAIETRYGGDVDSRKVYQEFTARWLASRKARGT